jgi:hypothetical protein
MKASPADADHLRRAYSKPLAARSAIGVPLETERGYHLMIRLEVMPRIRPPMPTAIVATPMALGCASPVRSSWPGSLGCWTGGAPPSS